MKHVLALILVTVAAVRPADAQLRDLVADARATLERYDIEGEVMKKLAGAMVGRVRRSIAIGPHAGGFGLIGAKDSASGGGISFGLGVYLFEVPTGLDLREVVKERVKDEVKEMVKSGRAIDGEQVIREIVDKVVKDILDGAYGSQTWPPPRLSILVEGQSTLGDIDGFGGRLAVAMGFSKLSVGISSSVLHANDTTTALFGPELAIRLTPIGAKRTPVFDLFGRVEFGARSEVPIQVAVGMRLLLDVI